MGKKSFFLIVSKTEVVMCSTHMFVEYRACQPQKWYRYFFAYVITIFNLIIFTMNKGCSFHIPSIIVYVILSRIPSIFELYQPLLTLRSSSKTQLFVIFVA